MQETSIMQPSFRHLTKAGVTPVVEGSRKVSVLQPWLRAQAINVTRHAAALRPFHRHEFGNTPEAPTESHIQAVNSLIKSLRGEMLNLTRIVSKEAQKAGVEPSPSRLQGLMRHKEMAHGRVQSLERIWDFYFELFGQRQSRFGSWLLSTDRIALDCYQHAYLGLGAARSVPTPPPFTYMRTGFSPATFRRGIPLRRLGQQLNPFALIQLPYHRMVNPWTLGAVLHEVGHNLHNDLGLAKSVPRMIAKCLLHAGCSSFVTQTWVRWNREIFADLIGLLLGGPAVVASLMDVIGRGPKTVFGYLPTGPHPTPYLRAFISIELLRRMGFPDEAKAYRRSWHQIYPNPRTGILPESLLENFSEVIAHVVNAVCFTPYPSLGGRALSQVIEFAPKEQQMIEEAATRLAAGTDPGIVPERFLIGASRVALDRGLARPGIITTNFYKELSRR
jgi:hypothetical protein